MNKYSFYDPNGFRCCYTADKELSPKWRHMLIINGRAILKRGVIKRNYTNI